MEYANIICLMNNSKAYIYSLAKICLALQFQHNVELADTWHNALINLKLKMGLFKLFTWNFTV